MSGCIEQGEIQLRLRGICFNAAALMISGIANSSSHIELYLLSVFLWRRSMHDWDTEVEPRDVAYLGELKDSWEQLTNLCSRKCPVCVLLLLCM